MVCFAWLARQTLEKKASNLPSVTGSKKTAILGEVYWA
ncbi:anhydro-N-acetylmuramic acid kinase [Candidatus Coxiella mudrowiae]|nr:anhydro-N-acetylmuramic acid kinase [Candidatus Coxiella mudrowiae]